GEFREEAMGFPLSACVSATSGSPQFAELFRVLVYIEETGSVHQAYRVRRGVPKEVDPPSQAGWVGACPPPEPGRVMACAVKRQSGFLVPLLADVPVALETRLGGAAP